MAPVVALHAPALLFLPCISLTRLQTIAPHMCVLWFSIDRLQVHPAASLSFPAFLVFARAWPTPERSSANAWALLHSPKRVGRALLPLACDVRSSWSPWRGTIG